jgi:hypothetical protein
VQVTTIAAPRRFWQPTTVGQTALAMRITIEEPIAMFDPSN